MTQQNQFISENVWALDVFNEALLLIHAGWVCEVTGGGEKADMGIICAGGGLDCAGAEAQSGEFIVQTVNILMDTLSEPLVLFHSFIHCQFVLLIAVTTLLRTLLLPNVHN